MCYDDGNLENHRIHNCFVLHICDVLNIHMRRKKGFETKVLIRGYTLNQIGPNTKSKFIEQNMTSDQLAFLETNIDYIYRQYCYYGNYSYIPVRTYIDHNCSTSNFPDFS